MTPVPAPSLVLPQEDWADTDFELPDGDALTTHSDAESDNDEDWDTEMGLGKTGGASLATPSVSSPLASPPSTSAADTITIHPPPARSPTGEQADDEDDYEDDGASTIKVAHIPLLPLKKAAPAPPPAPDPSPPDDDIENAFELPSDLSRLSLRPLTLHHRPSKSSLEWGDRDHTSSSTSSDAYSTLGFGPSASPSTNSTSAPSAGELETDDDDDGDDGDLDGLVLPTGLFDSRHSTKQLAKMLETKKRLPAVAERAKAATADSEDDFEIGLVIDDDVDLSPSRLPSNRAQPAADTKKQMGRSKSAPARPPPVRTLRPAASKLTTTRAKSPTAQISAVALKSGRTLTISPAPPVSSSSRLAAVTRSSTLQALSSAPPASHNSSFLPSGPLRAQKSHSVLKPPSPRGANTSGHLARKASLSSLIDAPSACSVQGPAATTYTAPTAASRARMQPHAQLPLHAHATTRLRAVDAERPYAVPPTRPTTPSTSTAALRLTMPTSSSRAKARPAIAAVFGPGVGPGARERAPSPLLPTSRPSSSTSTSVRGAPAPATAAAKVLRRPKRARTYGDGTELDGIEDLPTDRDKERRFRVAPKGAGAPRLGKAAPEKDPKETVGRKAGRREAETKPQPAAPITNTLRRRERIDFGAKAAETLPRHSRRKKGTPQTPSGVPGGTTKRKPTLIRNLGGAGAPKVVGDMRWNPQTLRWEGNDQALREFDAASARPALITHLTGSSMGSPVPTFGGAGGGARVVGHMLFDSGRMCWVSRLPPEEDEPDVFAGLGDDDDEEEDEGRGGTIRAVGMEQSVVSAAAATRGGDTPSPGRPGSAHSRGMSESGSERGARPALGALLDVDGRLLDKCRAAETRHRAEMKGWRLRGDADADRAALYEIRALATRQY